MALLFIFLFTTTSFATQPTSQPKQPLKTNLAASQENNALVNKVILQSANGPISLHDLQGKFLVMFFGYTNCPDICPYDLSIIAQAFNNLKEHELQHVQGIFVSLDPARDDAKTLEQYTRYFHSNIIGLTGSKQDIQKIAKHFGIHYKKVMFPDSEIEYGFDHTAQIYILDKLGRLNFVFPNGISSTALHQAVEFLLTEQQKP